MTLPRWDSVAALYCLQKSMMLTPCGPRAVPTGGAGVAAPAFSCTLTTAAIFFFLGAISWVLTCVLYYARRGQMSWGQSLETWSNESSTGVSRPKIDTSTLSFWVSGLISLTVAGSVANGPSITVTDSPTSYSTGRWVISAFAAFSSGSGASSVATSVRLSGDGRLDRPTKPVTPGVLRTAAHDSSVRSIRTRM